MLTQLNHSEYARAYKRNVASKYRLVDGANINEKIDGTDFCATRKYDGIMQVVFVDNGSVCAYNSGGNPTSADLPCMKEFVALAQTAGVTGGIFGAELYATISKDGRERVCDVAQALANETLHGQLHLAIFDVREINGVEIQSEHYKDKLAKIRAIFGKGNLARPVAAKCLQSKADLAALYDTVVTNHNAEGLVVHNEGPIIYKVKPRHSIDVVIIGYTAGEDERREMVRDVLCAVIHPDGTLRQVASVGTGLTDEVRCQWYHRLSQMHTDSEYIDTDSRNVAFQMVHPEMVIEISAVDYVTENAVGEAKLNMLLTCGPQGYVPLGKDSGVVLHSPVFLRERADKTACATDVRLSQLTDLCEFAKSSTTLGGNLPASIVLARRVFTKRSGVKVMMQKFMVWKTNKEHTGRFPAYVLHHTDYNYSRQEQLRRDIRVSDSREQIFALMDDMIDVNIKKGWEESIC